MSFLRSDKTLEGCILKTVTWKDIEISPKVFSLENFSLPSKIKHFSGRRILMLSGNKSKEEITLFLWKEL